MPRINSQPQRNLFVLPSETMEAHGCECCRGRKCFYPFYSVLCCKDGVISIESNFLNLFKNLGKCFFYPLCSKTSVKTVSQYCIINSQSIASSLTSLNYA